MRAFSKKIFLVAGLITLGVIPNFVLAQTADASTLWNTVSVSTGTLGVITLITPVLYTLMTLAAAAMGLAGLFLDFILKISVLELDQRLSDISSINTTWRVIRDIANMSFIFILLYEGVRMILGLEGTGIKKVVGNIVVAAILVNFSLFFTKVVIDASNIITLGFYNAIIGAGDTSTGLAGILMNVLRLNTVGLFNLKGALSTVLSGANGITVLIGNTIFLLVGTFVFLAISVMFVIRYLSFILLLIMSPIAFVSTAVPGLTWMKEKYVKTLTSQALFAPVFMLLTWVMLTLAGDSNFLSSSNQLDRSWWEVLTLKNNTNYDVISTVVDYVLIIGLLLYTLIFSKEVATKSGFVTNNVINKGQSYLGGVIFGGASVLGRSTLGRYGQKLAEDDDLKKRAASGDRVARFKLLAGNKLATSSFDVRNIEKLEEITKRTGGFGSGINKKGYRGFVESKLTEQKTADEARAKQFFISDSDKQKYKDILNSQEFKAQEEAEKEAHLLELDARIAANRKKLGITDLEESVKTFEQSQKKASTDKASLATSLETLKQNLAKAAFPDEKAVIEAEIERKTNEINTLTAAINDTDKKIQEAQEKIKSIEQSEVYKPTLDIINQKDFDQQFWRSQIHEEYLGLSGGKKATKNEKAAGVKDIESVDNVRIKQYAERVAGKTWFGSNYIKPNFFIDSDYTKRRAAAVRKLIRNETKEEAAKKALKALQEDDDGTGDDKKTDNKNTTTPAPTPTPPTPTK